LSGDAVSEATRFEPKESVGGQPFWAGTRDGKFLVPWCTSCGEPHWYPREVCPHCLSTELEWREAAGTGTVYAVSVMPKPGNPMMAGREPYAVALVDLDEGVRMMSEVVGGDPWTVAVGDAVTLQWEPLSDGRQLPVWQRAGTA
jgi:uncharacterized OB-fold protein